MTTTPGKFVFLYQVIEAENKICNGFHISLRADTREQADEQAAKDAKTLTGKAKFISQV